MHHEIASKFTDVLESEKLSGGQGTSFRVGRFVLKPVDDPDKYSWMAETLQTVRPDGFSISRPVRSKAGNWVEDGFGATEFHPGDFEKGRMAEKLAVAERFHSATRSIPKPPQFGEWRSPWSQAAAVAWEEGSLPSTTSPRTVRTLETIFRQYRGVDLPSQFIHSDLAGNILFHGTDPVLIDISPDFRPTEYAHAMLVTDSIAWHGEPVSSLGLLTFDQELRRQMILRAVVFRLCVPVFFDPLNQKTFDSTLAEFSPVLDYAV
jgi:uncharacterized protein (TIGR02569 family)